MLSDSDVLSISLSDIFRCLIDAGTTFLTEIDIFGELARRSSLTFVKRLEMPK